VLSLALVWLSFERASNNTVVMNDDDNDGRREIMLFWFVVAVCLFVCARSSINKREETEWDMTWEKENVNRLLCTHPVLHR
jgi:hypothetical protein